MQDGIISSDSIIMTDEKRERVKALAERILKLARDRITINFRFMSPALLRLVPVCRFDSQVIATDADKLFYDPITLIESYRREPDSVPGFYLHVILHCIFYHFIGYENMEHPLWDLSCDIAVENIVLEMSEGSLHFLRDAEEREIIAQLAKNLKTLTAERIYHYFLTHKPDDNELNRMRNVFMRDDHSAWKKGDEIIVSEAQWRKISEKIKTDIGTFSKNNNHSEALNSNLFEVNRERYDYDKILRKFAVSSEDMLVNDDEFDYIYYMYGLNHYENMPLIEPLEYKEVEKIRDFAIVLDTSASVRGDLVKSFIKKTVEILKSEENFFRKMNVHIIQCDNEIRQDVVIQSQDDFDEFLRNGKLSGFSGTDFRPAFEYVDELVENNEFTNFKGLIYFTDGYGVFPERAPDYDAMFVFINREGEPKGVPWWVIKVNLDEEEYEYQGSERVY